MAWFPYGALLAVIALLALGALALLLRSLWRRTQALMGVVATASETVAASIEALERAQAASPRRAPARGAPDPAARHLPDARRSSARHR